jgi:hypothetical protein
MANGSKVVPCRIPGDLLAQIEAEIARVNKRRTDEPFNLSSWLRQAILEKLDHSRRGRSRPMVYYTPTQEGMEKGRPE